MGVYLRCLPIVLLAACAHNDVTGHAPDAHDQGGGTPDARVQQGNCPTPCTAPDECCDVGGQSFCIDTSAGDMNNCGGCGVTCQQEISDHCVFSQCNCGFEKACDNGQQCCGGGTTGAKCSDLMTDSQHCGNCDTACGANEECQGGHCVCAGSGRACTASETCCTSGCADTSADNANCGGCDMPCDATSTCNAGMCACAASGTVCTPGQRCCDTGCLGICFDATNCGACGHVCPGGSNDACLLGVCVPSELGTPNPPDCIP